MEIIKNLNKTIVDRNIGFKRNEEWDFTDDGTRFKGYEYKGFEIDTCRCNELTYLTIKVDFYSCEFTYDEWRATEESKLCDEFNGVPEIDLDKLIENCERIIAKVDELNTKCKDEVIDMTAVKKRAEFELGMLCPFFDDAKRKIKWWDKGKFDLERIAHCMKGVERTIWELSRNYDYLSRREKKSLVEQLNKYGYIKLLYTGSDWYTENLLEHM